MLKLDLSTLESWLWDSANILRGSIDSSNFKNYIFKLLFLKWVNDVYEEEVKVIMTREGIGRDEAEPYFKIPPEARCSALKKVTENIGTALDIAFAAIERENSKGANSLEGVLTATKFGDKEKLCVCVSNKAGQGVKARVPSAWWRSSPDGRIQPGYFISLLSLDRDTLV